MHTAQPIVFHSTCGMVQPTTTASGHNPAHDMASVVTRKQQVHSNNAEVSFICVSRVDALDRVAHGNNVGGIPQCHRRAGRHWAPEL